MKRLSDYTGADAIELWADIFDPISTILTDEDVKRHTSGKSISINDATKVIVKKYPKETFEILGRVNDKEEINGANAFPMLVSLVAELVIGDKASTFFKSAEPVKSDEESSGSATENIEDGVK